MEALSLFKPQAVHWQESICRESYNSRLQIKQLLQYQQFQEEERQARQQQSRRMSEESSSQVWH